MPKTMRKTNMDHHTVALQMVQYIDLSLTWVVPSSVPDANRFCVVSPSLSLSLCVSLSLSVSSFNSNELLTTMRFHVV